METPGKNSKCREKGVLFKSICISMCVYPLEHISNTVTVFKAETTVTTRHHHHRSEGNNYTVCEFWVHQPSSKPPRSCRHYFTTVFGKARLLHTLKGPMQSRTYNPHLLFKSKMTPSSLHDFLWYQRSVSLANVISGSKPGRFCWVRPRTIQHSS